MCYKLHVAIHGRDLASAVVDAERRLKEERSKTVQLEARLRAATGQHEYARQLLGERTDELRSARKELADTRAYLVAHQLLCAGCGARQRDVVLQCGHMVLCSACVDARRAARCPKCPTCGDNFGRLLHVRWT